MCAGGCQDECQCENSIITLEQIAGSPGEQGPPGTTVIGFFSPNFSSLSTGVDVQMSSPASGTDLPTGTRLPINELPTNGSFIETDTYITVTSDTSKTFKQAFGPSGAITMFTVPFVPVGKIQVNARYTRITSTTVQLDFRVILPSSIYYTYQVPVLTVNDLTTMTNELQFFINQAVASTITIDRLIITKYLKA